MPWQPFKTKERSVRPGPPAPPHALRRRHSQAVSAHRCGLRGLCHSRQGWKPGEWVLPRDTGRAACCVAQHCPFLGHLRRSSVPPTAGTFTRLLMAESLGSLPVPAYAHAPRAEPHSKNLRAAGRDKRSAHTLCAAKYPCKFTPIPALSVEIRPTPFQFH